MTTVIRYVPTYINKDGMRTLMRGAQGRYTFETADAAQAWIAAVYATGTNSQSTLDSVYGQFPHCEVRPCECWPGHFDPVGIYFDSLYYYRSADGTQFTIAATSREQADALLMERYPHATNVTLLEVFE